MPQIGADHHLTAERINSEPKLANLLSFPTAKWRFLDNCHHKRNLALYDRGEIEYEPLITELIAITKQLQAAVYALAPSTANQRSGT